MCQWKYMMNVIITQSSRGNGKDIVTPIIKNATLSG